MPTINEAMKLQVLRSGGPGSGRHPEGGKKSKFDPKDYVKNSMVRSHYGKTGKGTLACRHCMKDMGKNPNAKDLWQHMNKHYSLV